MAAHMEPTKIPKTVNIPTDLYRRRQQSVADEGAGQCSQRLSLEPPLIAPAGRGIDLTNNQIYELIELP